MSKRRSGLHNDKKAYCCKANVVCYDKIIENLTITSYFELTGDNLLYNNVVTLTWSPIPNGIVYLINQPGVLQQTFELLTPTSGNYYTNNIDYRINIVVYAHVNKCPNISGSLKL